MFKTKYRIREYIKADGSSSYFIQRKFLLFFWEDLDYWTNTNPYPYSSLIKARKEIDRLYSNEIVSSKIHY